MDAEIVMDYRETSGWRQARLAVCAILACIQPIARRLENRRMAMEIDHLSVSILENLTKGFEAEGNREALDRVRAGITLLEDELTSARARNAIRESDIVRLQRELVAAQRLLSAQVTIISSRNKFTDKESPMIRTTNLKRTYTTDEVETTALNNVNIEIQEGEFVAIMGPSGCGKSTLLNILGLLDNPSGGEYYFLSREVSKFSERQRANMRKANIGFVFQSFNLIDELTVYENVELPLFYLGVASSERENRVNEVLEHMQVMHRRNHFPQQLSGGQQQRVAVARAIVARPKLILADEPTGNLDSAHGSEVMKLLSDLNESGTTIVMVTHSTHDARGTAIASSIFLTDTL